MAASRLGGTMARRSFGSLRRLPSGRWQARYRASDGKLRSAPDTFLSRGDAARWLSKIETDIARGSWSDPSAGSVTLRDYANAWVAQRTVKGKALAPRTVDTYRHSLDAHIFPKLGDVKLTALTPALVRTWHSETMAAGPTAARQAYALLRAVLNTAVSDDAIGRNPCRVPGAGQATSPERPLMTVEDVYRINAEMPEHLRALVVVAFFAHLRIGEAVALRYGDIDLVAGTLRVERQQIERASGPAITAPKVSSARTVSLPTQAIEALASYIAARPGLPAAPLFTRKGGERLRAMHVQQAWSTARTKAGVPEFVFHDLRHLGLTLVAQLGGTTKEIMARGGHASSRAALIYQHASAVRDRDLAALLSALPVANRLPSG